MNPSASPRLRVNPVLAYKAAIAQAMSDLSSDPAHIFVGYGLTHGRAMGTIPREANILETPVAENLMMGVACGLALTGRRPLVYVERMDFLLNALDCLVNHIDKAAGISRGEFSPGVIVRVTVGNSEKPLFTGEPHTQDFYAALRLMLVRTVVVRLHQFDDIVAIYAAAAAQQREGKSTVIVEYKDLI